MHTQSLMGRKSITIPRWRDWFRHLRDWILWWGSTKHRTHNNKPEKVRARKPCSSRVMTPTWVDYFIVSEENQNWNIFTLSKLFKIASMTSTSNELNKPARMMSFGDAESLFRESVIVMTSILNKSCSTTLVRHNLAKLLSSSPYTFRQRTQFGRATRREFINMPALKSSSFTPEAVAGVITHHTPPVTSFRSSLCRWGFGCFAENNLDVKRTPF